ncbi:MAG: trypsin-like serine protease, partial [Myxococcota bacterium]
MSLALLGVVLVASPPDALVHAVDDDPQAVVGGDAVPTCGWPTTVYTGGCTATLVHKKAISTAQHCGAPSSIQFGESAGGGPSVGVLGCVGDGSQDAMLCELAEEVTQVPVTPVLFGCEAEQYLTVGQPVVMVGFGQTSFGNGGGSKRWANQTIAAVEAGRTIVGMAGDGTSPCPGDSGGPVFLQVEDGSWRVFGTVLGGTTGTPCNSAADFQRIDTVVGNFENQTGLDITPCF